MNARRWKDADLARLREMYEESDMPLIYISAEMRTSVGTVSRLAIQHGWERRRPVACGASRYEEMRARLADRQRVLQGKVQRYLKELNDVIRKLNEPRRDGKP